MTTDKTFVGVRVPIQHLKVIDQLVWDHFFKDRSDFIQQAINEKLSDGS